MVSAIRRKYIWEILAKASFLTSQGLGKHLCLVIFPDGVTLDSYHKLFLTLFWRAVFVGFVYSGTQLGKHWSHAFFLPKCHLKVCERL